MGYGICTGDLGRMMRNSDDFIILGSEFRGMGIGMRMMMMQLQSRGGSYGMCWWEELDGDGGWKLFIFLFLYF